ncbi:hypothetical protein GQ53DRAFT_634446 [Thozetella sp. PMI_491]|nr:hypothetical protein GQ53DRAFT_634446 [Thozetella sp. PMI_491]
MGASTSKPTAAPRRAPPSRLDPLAAGAMPSFFSFQQGSESSQHVRYHTESSPLLGRFRAVPRPDQQSPRRMRSSGHLGLLSAGGRGSVHVGYGALVAAELEAEEADASDEDAADEAFYEDEGRLALLAWRLRRLGQRIEDTWVTPRATSVKRVVDAWWSRWTVLVVFPASMAVAWCAIPFPQYDLPEDDGKGAPGDADPDQGERGKVPGHGQALVQVNFWFFLFVYYAFYNLTALIWITKVFNIYSLNWWPKSLGFPLTVSFIAVVSLAVPIPIYLRPETRFLTVHNTAWITWSFIIMALPVAIAFCILMTNERHLGLRHSLSETQRIFTSSWWAGEPENTLSRRDRRRQARASSAFDPNLDTVGIEDRAPRTVSMPVRMRRRWLPASFVRFVWFCLVLAIGLLAYEIGEAYAEIYLRTLPHNNLETIVYVYGWILTVYLLDGVTGWILGGNEGERVGSYPLSWIFKLYFMLTYQTYVRALYARLRSPSQFITLQILSSSGLIIVTPMLMSKPLHWFLSVIGVNTQSYQSYQKMCVRNVFIRFLAENVSMMAFLGSVVVLHFGANKNVYPYFAFDELDSVGSDGYNFDFTFWASSITWGCELIASFIVAGLIRWIYGVSVVTEGKLDLAVWPELLPTSVAVMLHVLQNMLFSIIRLQFR